MAVYYLDSSALLKQYAQEVGSEWVQNLTDVQNIHILFVSLITGVEIVSALTQRVRQGSIDVQAAKQAVHAFRQDWFHHYEVILTTDEVIDRAMQIAEAYGLRAYDAVQLASACWVQQRLISQGSVPLEFISSDSDLNQAAFS
ncbi:MAG: type II toxin-antitoxin system VapC family toxin [Fimbriimonadia bacterium]|nr:type II toxin-antitoxin system VapC family toxin [Fimbriimonadia bacterium]